MRATILATALLLLISWSSAQAHAASEGESEKSAAAAFALELLLPGAGLWYVDEYETALVEVLTFTGGVVLFTTSSADGNRALGFAGAMMMVAARLLGLVAAPALAKRRAPPPLPRPDPGFGTNALVTF